MREANGEAVTPYLVSMFGTAGSRAVFDKLKHAYKRHDMDQLYRDDPTQMECGFFRRPQDLETPQTALINLADHTVSVWHAMEEPE